MGAIQAATTKLDIALSNKSNWKALEDMFQ